MGDNQTIALQKHLEKWKEQRAVSLPADVNVFEYYCLEHFLRDWISSDEELKSGLVGGGGDGGVDGMYFFIDDELVADTSQEKDSAQSTTLLVFQVKEGDGFSPEAIRKLKDFADDLLNIGKPESQYHQVYRPDLVKLMQLFKTRYQLLMSSGLPDFEIQFFYITKKDVQPDENCLTREQELKAEILKLFNKTKYSFNFINATKLWDFIDSRPKKIGMLKWAQPPMETPEGYVGLVRLTDYFEFLTDKESKALNKTIFESNVRGFWPKTPINKDILKTLDAPTKSTEFWLLNNGITILASDTKTAGFQVLEIHDPQIVNGLQSSRMIYDYFHSKKPAPDYRRILVKVIKLPGETDRDNVIRSTNSQNKMPIEALRATEPIHHEIESLFVSSNLFYDRRKGHYRDLRKPISDIVSIVEVLQAVVSCLLGRPDHARGRPRSYFGENDNYPYEDVFGKDKYNLQVYLHAFKLLRRVDKFLESTEAIHRRNLRFYMCTFIASTLSGHARVLPADLLKIDADSVRESTLRAAYKRIQKMYQSLAEKNAKDDKFDYDGVAKGTDLIKKLASTLNRRYPNGPKLSI